MSARFQIIAAGLSNEPVVEDWEAFNARSQQDLTKTIGHLNSLPTDGFEPDLDLLDEVVQSLIIETR